MVRSSIKKPKTKLKSKKRTVRKSKRSKKTTTRKSKVSPTAIDLNKPPTKCAPHVDSDNISCYNKESLVKIAKAYNQKAKKSKSKKTKSESKPSTIKYTGKSKKTLWKNIRNNLSQKCGNNEVCWLDTDFMKGSSNREELLNKFRPEMPEEWKKNKHEWLATDDIDSVMEQYEVQYPSFKFLGTVPSDCPTGIYCELSNIQISKMEKEGVDKLGVVFNLDKHNQPGSHWVALFVNLNKGEVNYYDSYGHEPISSIRKFMTDMSRKLNDYYNANSIRKKCRMQYNKHRHQYGGSECGVYSMNFLIQSLKGKSMQSICKQKIPDHLMNEMRRYLYR